VAATVKPRRLRPWALDERFLVGDDGAIVGPRGHELRTFLDRDGYPRFNRYEAGKWSQHPVHAVVCETFHGPRPAGAQAAHTNGHKTDCRAVNLSWKTPAENEADKVEHDTRAWGDRHGMHKLTEDEVRTIRASREQSITLARRHGVTTVTIRAIRARRTWRHI
jgi:hypothetical protein